MKSFRQFLFIGLAFAIVLTSCTMEKRVYMQGYHIEWLKGKKSSDKQTASCQTPKVQDNKIVMTEQLVTTVNTVDNNSLDQALIEENIIASVDNNAIVLPSQKPISFYNKTATPVKVETAKEAKMYIKQAVKKAKVEKAINPVPSGKDKSWIATLLLCIFLGGIGIHRFYLGYTWQGVVQLLTFGGCGVWALIDLIRIIIKDLKPKNGNYKD